VNFSFPLSLLLLLSLCFFRCKIVPCNFLLYFCYIIFHAFSRFCHLYPRPFIVFFLVFTITIFFLSFLMFFLFFHCFVYDFIHYIIRQGNIKEFIIFLIIVCDFFLCFISYFLFRIDPIIKKSLLLLLLLFLLLFFFFFFFFFFIPVALCLLDRKERESKKEKRKREREREVKEKEKKEITIVHADIGTFVAGSVPPSPSSQSVCCPTRPHNLSHRPSQVHPPPIDLSTARLQVLPLSAASHGCFQVFL
jgi:hypothetical protein